MQKHIKTLLKDNIFIIAICITVLIAYLSFIRISFSQPKISGIDKWQHAFAYFTLTICWLFSFYKKPAKKYVIAILCIVYGIIIEVLQDKLTMHRTGDYNDILANTSGVVLGLILFNQILKKK